MRPFASLGLTILGLAAVSILFVGGAPARPAAKTFPPGCWKGTGVFNGSFKKGPVSATVTNGKLKFGLVVSAGKEPVALGGLITTGHGTGHITVSGSSVDMEVNLTGDFDLHGSPSDVIVDGHYRYKGVALFQGTTIPVDIKLPVEGAPLVINGASGTTAHGQFGKSKWTAVRIAKLGVLTAQACFKKTGV
jgi:hypothetical protein